MSRGIPNLLYVYRFSFMVKYKLTFEYGVIHYALILKDLGFFFYFRKYILGGFYFSYIT